MLFLNIIIYVVKYFLILLTVILFSCSSQEETSTNIPDNGYDVKPKLEKSEIIKNESQDNKDENKTEEPVNQTIVDDSFTPLLSIEFRSDSDNYIKANYRVTEQLARLSYPIDAVGYTEDITGGIYLDENGIPAPESIINIDLSNLKSDESKRDNYLKRNSLETDKFPEVFFYVKEIKNLNEEEKKNYIQEIIRSDLEEAGQEDVFRKIKKDFQKASISIEETEIRDQMEKALLRAKEDFKK